MLDSDFWRDLAADFRATDLPQFLRAEWHYFVRIGEQPPAVAEWKLPVWGIRKRSIALEFQALARRGGPKVYPRMDSLVGWLEALRGSRLNAEDREPEIKMAPDGTIIGHLYSGSIARICQASVDFCKALESEALETERMANLQQEIQDKAEQQRAYRAALDENQNDSENPEGAAPTTELTETIGAQLNRLKEECRWTLEQLAEAVEIDPTNVSRHLSDKSAPRLKNLGAYERVFSKELKTKIVIHKTPRKRR